MANKFLGSVCVDSDQEFAIIPDSTHYALRRRRVRFFRCNPEPTPNMREIPRDANTMWFPDYKVNRGDIDYGEPEFRGHGINSTHRD